MVIFIFVYYLTFCFTMHNQTMPCVYASSQTRYFARIMSDDAYLYRSPLDAFDQSNLIFILPKTYFVELLGEAGNNFYQVQYKSLQGYVKKADVKAIKGEPSEPYLSDINFRVYAEPSRDMRSEPNTEYGSSSQVIYVPLYSKNLVYFGKIFGEALVDERTDIWYYCKYTADKEYYGYIYSDFCDKLPTIMDNTEEVEYIDTPLFTSPDEEQNSIPLESNTTWIIVGIISIPAIIFLYMIVKNVKLHPINKTNKEITEYDIS